MSAIRLIEVSDLIAKKTRKPCTPTQARERVEQLCADAWAGTLSAADGEFISWLSLTILERSVK
jgi:hypothetical protein